MRKLLLLFLIFFIPRICFAAISASAVFEFRSTATANMVNGGGFVTGASGTDYSTNDTAHLTITDLASDGAGGVSSTLTPFDAQDVGNILHITATGTGLTIGWYEVISVAAAVATLDRSPGASKTGGSAYLGGALNVGNSLEDDFFEEISGANATDGITVYFYNNNSTSTVTFTPSEAINIAGAGGAQAPIKILGYKTTRGDNPTGGSRPTIACGANTFTLGTNFDVYNLQFTGTGSSVLGTNSSGKLINCKVTNSSSTASRNSINLGGNDNIVLNSELVSYFGRGIAIADYYGNTLIGNYIHDSDIGIRLSAQAAANGVNVLFNIVESNVTSAITIANLLVGRLNFINNILYGSENTTGIGVSINTGVTDLNIFNNIIYGFATGVSHADAAQTVGYDDYNAYFNNDTDVTNWTKGSNDVATNPTFTSVGQVTGTAGAFVAGGSKLVDTSKNFTTSGVVAGDCVYIVSGTGVTAGIYLINSISTTTNPNDTLNITIPASPGTNTTADKVYQITTGHNFAIGTNLKALGFPGAFQGGFTTGYLDIGAVQRQESATGGVGAGTFFIND